MKIAELIQEGTAPFTIEDGVDKAEIPLVVTLFGKLLNEGKDCWIRYGHISRRNGPLLHIVEAEVGFRGGPLALHYWYKVPGQRSPSSSSFTFMFADTNTWKLTRVPKGPRLKKDRWILDVE